MNTELALLASAASNPFAALMSPELVIQAHQRLSARVAGVVHRPLDKPRLGKTGPQSPAAGDAEDGDEEIDTDAEFGDDGDSACDVSDIVRGSFGGHIRLAV